MSRIVAAVALLALASCQGLEDTNKAEEQVAAFHAAFDSGQYGRLWDGSAPTMQQITPRPQFEAMLTDMRQRLGNVKSSKQTGWSVNYDGGASQVTLTYETTFANGEGTETFIYDTQDPPKLMGWHVESPVLLQPVRSAPGVAEIGKDPAAN